MLHTAMQCTALLLQIELDTALGRLEVVVSVRGSMLEELVFLENLLAETDLILSTRLYTSSYEQLQGVSKEKHGESNI